MSGPACLATIAKQYGLFVSTLRMKELSFCDKNGCSILGLIKAAMQLEFSAKSAELKPDELDSTIPLPAIVRITKKDYKKKYYVVVHKIDNKGILVADPVEGLSYYDPDDFFRIWSGSIIILTPKDEFKRGDLESGLLSRFFTMLWSQKKMITQIILASLILTIFGIVSAFYFKYLVDDILTNGLKDTLIIVSFGLVIIKLFTQIMSAFRNHLLLYFSQKIDVSLILQYYRHVLDLPVSFFGSRKVGEIISRSSDAQKIRRTLSSTTFSIVLDSLMVVVGGIIVFSQNAALFLTVSLILPFYFLVVFLFKHPFKQMNRDIMEKSAEMQSCLVETFSAVEIIKANNGEESANFEIEKRYMQQRKLNFKMSWMNNLQTFLKDILSDFNTLLIWWLGGLQVINGQITLGQLMTFNALLSYFINPVKNLINLQSTLQEAYVAAERLVEILDLEIEKKNDEQKLHIEQVKGDLEFKNVFFRYGGGRLILDDISFNINAGEKVALVGETGCGKTTLAKLLLRFYSPEKGQILIDGVNINNLSLESLRDCIGYVPQENYLFSGTIRDNITFGTPNATMEEIIKAAKTAQIHDFIEELPLSYDTVIAERGSSLSGGQRQRISIARAILKKPDLLILDEATSNLDSVTERAVHNTVDNITEGLTSIIIAHRLSTIVKCDRIIVLDKGKILESGTHYELLKNKGRYYQLWQVQLDSQEERKFGVHVS